jgi:hypothetical protein
MSVAVEPHEHRGDEDDHRDDRTGTERRDLEHRGLQAGRAVCADPAHDRYIERLRSAGSHLLGDLGKCPRAQNGDEGSGQQENSEDRIGIADVAGDETNAAEHDIPKQTAVTAGLSLGDVSTIIRSDM